MNIINIIKEEIKSFVNEIGGGAEILPHHEISPNYNSDNSNNSNGYIENKKYIVGTPYLK